MASGSASTERLQRNRTEGNCEKCQKPNHVAEWCPGKWKHMHKCEGSGHLAKNCHTLKFVRDFSLQLPFDRPACFGSGRKYFRNCGIDHLLPFLSIRWSENLLK